jgi:hypothetical protein
MTEEEGFSLIHWLTDELRDLNVGDPWIALVSGAPFEVRDEDDQPTGEFYVAAGWVCWVRNSRTATPKEWGRALALYDTDMEPEHLRRMLEFDYQNTVGDKRTFRTLKEAREATFV